MANRQPVLTRAGIVAAVGVAVTVLGHFGVAIPANMQNEVTDAVMIVGPIVLALWSARKVTPTADPKNDAGFSLVPSVAATIRAAVPAVAPDPAYPYATFAPAGAPVPAPSGPVAATVAAPQAPDPMTTTAILAAIRPAPVQFTPQAPAPSAPGEWTPSA